MKLHSVLLGGVILTKPCVCPQVLHGSMRLAGGPGVGATVRGMKPSRECSKPGSLKLGEALVLENMVKLLNAFKHRHSERATRGCLRLGQKASSRARVV